MRMGRDSTLLGGRLRGTDGGHIVRRMGDVMDKRQYQVIVGNVGTVLDTWHENDARRAFNEYVRDSKAGYGRVAHEPVALLCDGEPIKEHAPAPLWGWEYTDTFGGEANYSWVKRGTVEAETEAGAVRAAKKAAGLTGTTCRREEQGETIALYPAGSCTVLFITPGEV